jgi:hypothetical protein
MTSVVDGHWRIKDDPPTVATSTPGGPAALERTFSDYRATLAENRREPSSASIVDFALKVVGVGSVGTMLRRPARGATRRSLFPQAMKRLHRSSTRISTSKHEPRRARGRRPAVMQATPDIFLGWTRILAGATCFRWRI